MHGKYAVALALLAYGHAIRGDDGLAVTASGWEALGFFIGLIISGCGLVYWLYLWRATGRAHPFTFKEAEPK